MNLELPTPTVTLGPEWAQELNDALGLVDAHDHSSGFGVKVKPAGMDINADLNFNLLWRLINAKSTRFTDQATTLTGATNADSIYAVLGNLYFTNSSGVAVQLTSGSSIISAPSSVNSLTFSAISGDLTIGAGDSYVYLSINTSASRTITLPSASAVATGRIYVIADESGLSETNPLTLATDGSDTLMGATSQSLTSNFGTWFVIGNGTNKWCIV